ncbi:MAG: TraR/DksA C4-type zinc finger protein [Halieaceae bacterium]|nr:TraR/DksA C4-type zinc finger protein [Halieaceae bacterium]
MSELNLEHFRNRLHQLQAELEAVADQSADASSTVELDQSRVGRLSRMDAMQAQSMAQETARRRKAQLLRIEGALRRIDSGEYGECFACGEEIDPARLEFDPTTTRCVACKEAG